MNSGACLLIQALLAGYFAPTTKGWGVVASAAAIGLAMGTILFFGLSL